MHTETNEFPIFWSFIQAQVLMLLFPHVTSQITKIFSTTVTPSNSFSKDFGNFSKKSKWQDYPLINKQFQISDNLKLNIS